MWGKSKSVKQKRTGKRKTKVSKSVQLVFALNVAVFGTFERRRRSEENKMLDKLENSVTKKKKKENSTNIFN